MLDDAAPIRCIGELEAEDLGVLFRLLKSIPWCAVYRLRLHHRNRKIVPVPKEVVSSLLRPALYLGARHYDATIREALLLADLVVGPTAAYNFGRTYRRQVSASVRKGIGYMLMVLQKNG